MANFWDKLKNWVNPDSDDEYEYYYEPEESTTPTQNQVEITEGSAPSSGRPIPTWGTQTSQQQTFLAVDVPEPEEDNNAQLVISRGGNVGNGGYVPPSTQLQSPLQQPPVVNNSNTQLFSEPAEEQTEEQTQSNFTGWAQPTAENEQGNQPPQQNQNATAQQVGLSPEEMQALAAQTLGMTVKDAHISKLSAAQPPGEDSPHGFIKFRDGGGLTVANNKIFANEVEPQDFGSAASMMVATAKTKGWDSIAINGRDLAFQDHVFVEATLQGVAIDHQNSPTYPQPTSNALEMLKDHCDRLSVNILDDRGQIDISKAFGVRDYNGKDTRPQNTNMFETELPEMNTNWRSNPTPVSTTEPVTSMPRPVPPRRGP